MKRSVLVLVCLGLWLAPLGALAQGAKFQAAGSEAPKTLEACQASLETCAEHQDGIPYLAAAYLGLWVILIGFLFLVDRGQLKLEAELRELKARQKKLESGGGPG
jgi:CcmD family protein